MTPKRTKKARLGINIVTDHLGSIFLAETNPTVVFHCSGNTTHFYLLAYSIAFRFSKCAIDRRASSSYSLLSRPAFTMLCVKVKSTTGLPQKISSKEKHKFVFCQYTSRNWHYDSGSIPLFCVCPPEAYRIRETI